MLAIGMATYDDYDGVYFSAQALRLYHPEIADDTEIVVVDNNPGGPSSLALRKLEQWVKGYRYIPWGGSCGTAVRDLIFRETHAEYVLCMDSHVLLAPGSVNKLLAWFRANPGSNDLLQGPMISDDLTTIATHFDPVWSGGMWGVWGTDERGRDPHSPPFEIGMQGLGVFACRREAWPGLNPRLRGFGGEEGCLHEKFRQRGNRTLCLPFLRWLHRFERPLGPRYQTDWEDRIRNYFILFDELGMDSEPVVRHFEEILGAELAPRVFDAVRKELANPFGFFDAIYCIYQESEPDRWSVAQERFRALGIAPRVRCFPAILIPDDYETGYALTHRAIIAEARKLALGNVMVFEDETVFAADTLEVLEGAARELRDRSWAMLYLGGHTWGSGYRKASGCEFLDEPRSMTCSYALAFNHTIFDRILADVPETPPDVALWLREHAGIDQYYREVLGEFRLATRPVVASKPSILPLEKRAFGETYLPRHGDWSRYYAEAERETDREWQVIRNFIETDYSPDFTAVLDCTCGHGRIAERFTAISQYLICSDPNPDALAFCRERVAHWPHVSCAAFENGRIAIPDESITFAYSWDFMVHFNLSELRDVFRELRRILRPEGGAFVHHSNYGALGGPPRPWNENPGCRACVSAQDVAMLCDQYRLEILKQTVIDWSEPSMDCLTILRKPGI
jgi:SAM-dependent methyltransferase